jgi:hypothetical protein
MKEMFPVLVNRNVKLGLSIKEIDHASVNQNNNLGLSMEAPYPVFSKS